MREIIDYFPKRLQVVVDADGGYLNTKCGVRAKAPLQNVQMRHGGGLDQVGAVTMCVFLGGRECASL